MTNLSTKGLDAAKTFFREEKLPFPFVPAAFRSDIHQIGPGVFGSGWPVHAPVSLYDIQKCMTESMRHPDKPFLLFGEAGHGVNSWAMHYYLVNGPLALFVQLPFGGVHMNHEASVGAITGTWGLLRDVIHAADEADVSPDERLHIIDSAVIGSRWAWVKKNGSTANTTWHEQQPVLYGALRSLILGIKKTA